MTDDPKPGLRVLVCGGRDHAALDRQRLPYTDAIAQGGGAPPGPEER